VGVAFAVGDVVVTLYVTLLLRYVTNLASTLVWIGFAINCTAFILSFWLVESPTWMASVGQKGHAARTFAYIAKFNGMQKSFAGIDEVEADPFNLITETKSLETVQLSEAVVRSDESPRGITGESQTNLVD